jgi:hypothetical protein
MPIVRLEIINNQIGKHSYMKNRIIALLVTFLVHSWAMAQCAMCKANAEQSVSNGSQTGNWLNYGILLLMTIPFVFFILVYWMYRKNNSEIDA